MNTIGELFSFGDFGVWKYIELEWIHVVDGSYSFISAHSYNKSYTLAVGEFGNIYFSDGSTWTRLDEFFHPSGGLNINDVWTDGQNVILLANATDNWPMNTIIYQGK